MSVAHSAPLSTGPNTPGAVLGMVERRVTLGTIAALVGLAAVAWVLTAQQALSMSDMVTGLAQVGTHMPNPMTAPVFMLMWLTMMIAMMFPTIAPMVVAHRLVVVHRGEGPVPLLAFVLGYIAVWTTIGLVPLAVFMAFRDLPDDAAIVPLLPRISGAVLVVAGLYQFTPWKRLCLRACRTPLSFIMTHNFGSGTGSHPRGPVARRVLPRVLLGAHDRARRRRSDESSVDGTPGAGFSGREELAVRHWPESDCRDGSRAGGNRRLSVS